MQVFEYRASKLQKESRIFSDEIRDDPWVLFHGTAACWEKEIDAAGLRTTHFPVSLQELQKIVRIFKSMNLRTDHFGSLQAFSFPKEVDGSVFRPVYLTYVPELAVCYCSRATAGGEVAEMTRGCLRDLRSWRRDKDARIGHCRRQLVDYEEARIMEEKSRFMKVSWSWLRAELAKLAPFERRLRKLSGPGHYGLVYALRFERPDVSLLKEANNDTYISKMCIPPDRIIAKARIFGDRCDHLDRWWPEKFHRDSSNPCTLIGAIRAEHRRQGKSSQVFEEFDREWNRAPIDPAAGVDLAERFDRDGLLQYLRQRHPEVFTDAGLCEQYGW